MLQTSYSLPAAVVMALTLDLALPGASAYKTGQYAMALGYDADCNAATACAVAGVRVGFSTIEKLPGFHMPDRYVNRTRPQLPSESKVSEQVDVMMRICERLILANGGQAARIGGKDGYRIRLQAPRMLEPLGPAKP